ncbi:MAG: hypothetical protein [Microvirus sp.]|nr:MAG: hypothetical protein [Microvirus sp.]
MISSPNTNNSIMKFKTQFNYHEFESRGENNYGVSNTVPDMTMSMRTIMERYAMGLPIAGNDSGSFEVDDLDIDPDETFLQGRDPRSLDLTEIAELKHYTKQKIKQIEADLRKKPSATVKAEELTSPDVHLTPLPNEQ